MRLSRARSVVLVLLAAIGLGAGGALWYCLAAVQRLQSTHELASRQIDVLVERAVRFDSSLENFEAQPDVDFGWHKSASSLLNELQAAAAELDATLPGVAMSPRARFAELLQRARETVEGARANFDAGRMLMALDVVETNGRPASTAMLSELAMLRGSVLAETAAAQKQWLQRAAAAAGAWALAWAIGLVGFASRQAAPEEAVAVAAPPPPSEPPAAIEQAQAPPAYTLGEVADLCERIGRVRETAELPALLAGSASVLRATGLVLWVRDGEALVAGASHGYPNGLAQRLGRVPLADENLITRAWHSGRCQTSAAAAGHRAAFAAPLLGSAGPFGVLAAELAPDADPKASGEAARLVAAQFASAVGETAADTQGSAGDQPAVAASQLEATAG